MAKKKIDINKVFNELLNTQKEIDRLEQVKTEKKSIMANYFEKSGTSSLRSDNGQVFVQDRVYLDYDTKGIFKELPKTLSKKFIDVEHKVVNWQGLLNVFKEHNIKPKDVKEFFEVTRQVNKEKLNALYDSQEITLNELKPFMHVTYKKTIVTKVKKENE